MATISRAEWEGMCRQMADHLAREEARDEKLDKLYQSVVIGNGNISLTEQVHAHQRWIDGVNKLIWILVTAFVGFLVSNLATVIMLIYTLYRVYPAMLEKLGMVP